MGNRTELLKKAAEGLRAIADLADEVVSLTENYDLEALLKKVPSEQKSLFEEKQEEKTVTFEEVQKILVEKARNGFKNEVHTLLSKYGANKLSDVKPDLYKRLMIDAEEYCRDISKNEIFEAAQWILANRMEDDLKELLLFHNVSSIEELPKSRYAGFLWDARRM